MSEFTDKTIKRGEKLGEFMYKLAQGENGAKLTKDYNILETQFVPKDILVAFDYLFDKLDDIEKIKQVSNKIFNLLYKILSSYRSLPVPEKSLLWYLSEDNARADALMKQIKEYIKQLNKIGGKESIVQLRRLFGKLLNIEKHYSTVQNILFPLLEEKWEYHQCLKLLWHIHDQIRNNIKLTIDILSSASFDLKIFNRVSASVFFDVYTVIFREEKVLFPVIMETIDRDLIDNLIFQLPETGLAFVSMDEVEFPERDEATAVNDATIVLPTGQLTIEQLTAIFNHLPVDITFVDANDEVKFFSTPKDRIFPRTKSIIGRKVQNCHPPDSVHIVNKIVDAFRKGEKDHADFWIQTRLGQFIYIRYFAVRNEKGEYLGTLEVTQEVSGIRKLEGEQRLLDWED